MRSPYRWQCAGQPVAFSFQLRATVRRHRRAQGGSPMLRSIRPKQVNSQRQHPPDERGVASGAAGSASRRPRIADTAATPMDHLHVAHATTEASCHSPIAPRRRASARASRSGPRRATTPRPGRSGPRPTVSRPQPRSRARVRASSSPPRARITAGPMECRLGACGPCLLKKSRGKCG